MADKKNKVCLIAAMEGTNGNIVYAQCCFQVDEPQWFAMNLDKMPKPGAFPIKIVQIELSTPEGVIQQGEDWHPQVITWK